jgi:hypothetical protein
MGLLQEGIHKERIFPEIVAEITPGQSGYIRGTDDAILLLHEVLALRYSLGLATWYILGDFERAFPRVWRSDLLDMLGDDGRITGGALALIGDIFTGDILHVWLSGASTVPVNTGLPEGGSLGPPLYLRLPESLVRQLLAKGHGVGLLNSIPPAWQGHSWSGAGSPVPYLVADLVHALRTGAALPSATMLMAWPALEASAARALDSVSKFRLVAIFQADDPILMASSRGALAELAAEVAAWAHAHKASFHKSSNKTVVMVTARPERSVDVRQLDPIHMPVFDACGEVVSSVALSYVNSHRWLGILWNSALDFTPSLETVLHAAGAVLATLAGLVAARAIPLHLAVRLFEGKVDSILEYSRWLCATSHGAMQRYDEAADLWARTLLGADSWRNAAVCAGELGWRLTGAARAACSIAARQARIISLCNGVLYKDIFTAAEQAGVGWAEAARHVLLSFGIDDWRSLPVDATYEHYMAHTRAQAASACLPSWRAKVEKHTAQVPYNLLQQVPSEALSHPDLAALPWSTQIAVRGWCRIRAGLPRLRALDGRRSEAKFQQCIFCNQRLRNATVHVVARCPHWLDLRNAFLVNEPVGSNVLAGRLCLAVLNCHPGSLQFLAAAELCDAIDRGASLFWSGSR